MKEPIAVPVKVEAHTCCWHESIRTQKGHGPFITNYTFTIGMLGQKLPKGFEKYTACCFCNQVK